MFRKYVRADAMMALRAPLTSLSPLVESGPLYH
jgi:hypothetical protein